MVLAEVIDWKDAPERDEKTEFATWTGQQAHALGSELWSICVRYCEASGPVLDFQLAAYKYDEKTGKLELVADAVGVRCNLTGERSTEIDDPGDRKLEPLLKTIELLNDSLAKRDERFLKMMDKSALMLEKSAVLTEGAFRIAESAFTMKDAVAGRVAEYDARRWDYELRREEIKQRHASFREALDAFPFDDLGAYWRARSAGGADVPANIRDAAAKLLASLTPEQKAELPAELVIDLEACLARAAEQDDDEMAALVLMALAPKLLEHQEAIGMVATDYQRALLMYIRDALAHVEP